jgi:hypothetical protein
MRELTPAAPAAEVEPWYGARVVPAGPWARRAACRAPDVDPTWFTVDEDAAGAAELLGKAKQVCRGCPVRLWCRIHADETGEYGVYAAETYSERVRRQRAWRQAVADAEAAERAVGA